MNLRTSAAAASALFFSSSAQTPDTDPDCEPPEDLWREMVQTATVGILTAFIGRWPGHIIIKQICIEVPLKRICSIFVYSCSIFVAFL